MGFVAMTATTDAELELDMFGMVVDPVGDYHPAAIHIPYGIWKMDGPLFSLLRFFKRINSYFSFYEIVVGATHVF
jgi:hypothetical protein